MRKLIKLNEKQQYFLHTSDYILLFRLGAFDQFALKMNKKDRKISVKIILQLNIESN